MYILIVGGGKTGSHLASLLLPQGHRVRVLEDRPKVVAKLRQELPREVIITGDGTDPNALLDADIYNVDVIAAVTGDDESNLVVTSLARFEFGVPRVIARVNSPKNTWLYTKEMGVDVAFDQADLIAKLIVEEISLGDMTILLKLRRGDYNLVEEKIPPGAPVVGRVIRDLQLPSCCVLAGIIRGEQVIAPRGDTVLQAEDEVLAVCANSEERQLAELLSGRKLP